MKPVLMAVSVAALALTGSVTGVVGPHAGQPAIVRASAVASAVSPAEGAVELERQTLLAINDVRLDHGLGPLRLNPGLVSAAREHSLSMAEHGYFGHKSWDGSMFWNRIRPLYPPLRGRFWATGENLVWRSPGLTARAAVVMWLNKSPHRKNLLNGMWRDIGLGAVRDASAPGVYGGRSVTILTADFGVR